VLCHVVLCRVMYRYNKGYSLLLYDNRDINAYMRTYYPGFVPSEWGGCTAGRVMGCMGCCSV
jgi:hypothetical protein